MGARAPHAYVTWHVHDYSIYMLTNTAMIISLNQISRKQRQMH